MAPNVKRDRDDYQKFLIQMGMTDSEVLSIARIESDLIPMPEGVFVELRDSPIEGKGLFATRQFEAGEFISPGRINGKRTPAGRYINHSSKPNATTVKSINGDLGALATRIININEEILIDYRNSMRVNFGITLEGESL